MKNVYTILLILVGFGTSFAQIRLEVVQYPEFLTPERRLFISTNYNGWDAAHPDYELKRDTSGVYFIDLPDTLTYFEYKFTQGAWALVEGNVRGASRPNRVYDRSREINPKRIQVTIDNWEKTPAYKFVIKTLPKNTPHDASIYVAGNFNNWDPGHPAYKFQKQSDGTFRLLVYTDLNKLEFKFTRGNWESVEGRENGRARQNRVLNRTELVSTLKDIDIDISSWEDLSGTFNYYSIYDILMLFAAFQGLLLILAISGIQDYNREANRWLMWIMGFVAVFIVIRVLWQQRAIAQLYPKVTLLPDFITFVYAPLFYFYIKKLLFHAEKLPYRWAWHFLPTAMMVLAYLPYFFTDNALFVVRLLNQDVPMYRVFWLVSLLGFVFNAYYWWKCRRAIQHYRAEHQIRYSYDHNLQYLNTVLFIQGACLVLWAFAGGILVLNYLYLEDVDYSFILKTNDIAWLIFSTMTYFLGYYAIHQPEIFKMPHPEEVHDIKTVFLTNGAESPTQEPPPQYARDKKEETLPSEPKQPDENTVVLAEKIDAFLRESRLYTSPHLSLNELASKLKMQPHLVSKIINEGFQKNFFDFINAYRIEEFKKLAQDKRYKHHTFVSLAYEVGFNSKTAFNRSFKKMTNLTPREYIASLEQTLPNVSED